MRFRGAISQISEAVRDRHSQVITDRKSYCTWAFYWINKSVTLIAPAPAREPLHCIMYLQMYYQRNDIIFRRPNTYAATVWNLSMGICLSTR